MTGAALLDERDDRGLALLRRATDSDGAAVFDAYEEARRFLVAAGRFEQAEEWRAYADQYAGLRAFADEERSDLRSTDEVAEHGLSADLVSEVVAILEQLRLKRAYLARRQLELMNDADPQWILVVERRRRHFRFERSNAPIRTARQIAEALESIFGAQLWVADGKGYRDLLWRTSRLPGALILGHERFTAGLRRPINVPKVALLAAAGAALLIVAARLA